MGKFIAPFASAHRLEEAVEIEAVLVLPGRVELSQLVHPALLPRCAHVARLHVDHVFLAPFDASLRLVRYKVRSRVAKVEEIQDLIRVLIVHLVSHTSFVKLGRTKGGGYKRIKGTEQSHTYHCA